MPYKTGIVGAARRNQGTGPFVARIFKDLGHEVSGVIGTTAPSISETISILSNQYDIQTQGYTALSTLLEEQPIELLAICSPPGTHLQYLEQALANGLHVFCEKPLWWPSGVPAKFSLEEYKDNIHRITELAREQQRTIHINTQWPYTLRDFYRLHPSVFEPSGRIEQFAMHLCPQSRGLQMIVDAASHGLSMLYQLAGSGDLADIAVDKSSQSDFDTVSLNFKYVHAKGTTDATFGLTNTQETPKPASYQINGSTVNRIITLPSYEIQLQSENSTIDIMDPLKTSIRDFIANIEADLVCDETALILGAEHLYTLIEACR